MKFNEYATAYFSTTKTVTKMKTGAFERGFHMIIFLYRFRTETLGKLLVAWNRVIRVAAVALLGASNGEGRAAACV
jgi:hypothetical protein